MVQNVMKDGRFKFTDKQKPRLEEENETKIDAFYVEPVDIMIVDTITSVGNEDSKPNNKDQTTHAYPKVEEDLVKFLNQCKLIDSEVMLCPRCNSVFDKEAAKKLERANPYQAKKFVWQDKPKEPSSNK